MPENKSANKLPDAIKDSISSEIDADNGNWEYRFWCPTCNKFSIHFENRADFPLMVKAFNTIDPGQNPCGHEGVTLQRREVVEEEWKEAVGSDAPRVAQP